MKDFSDVILRKFPFDEQLGFYVKPNIPASKLSKVLHINKKVQAAEVLAFHLFSGIFSSEVVIFTPNLCYFEAGSIKLEDVKGAIKNDRYVIVEVNQGGKFTSCKIKCANELAANLLQNVFNAISDVPRLENLAIFSKIKDYSKYSKEAIQWLELRDEIMQTIDMLYQKFMDGKISFIEYEEKKNELLSRL